METITILNIESPKCLNSLLEVKVCVITFLHLPVLPYVGPKDHMVLFYIRDLVELSIGENKQYLTKG